MKKRVVHKIFRTLVVLMALVVLSPLLLKPLHVFIHDEISHALTSKKHQADFSQKKEDCPTCDFNFFLFLEDIAYHYDTLSNIESYSPDDFLTEQNTIRIMGAKLGRGPPGYPDPAPHLSI